MSDLLRNPEDWFSHNEAQIRSKLLTFQQEHMNLILVDVWLEDLQSSQ